MKVYNADETGDVWRKLSSSTLALPGETGGGYSNGGGGGGVQPQKTQNYLEIPFWVLVFLGFLGFNWIYLRTFLKKVIKVFLPTVILL